MKKLIALFLMATMLVACGQEADTTEPVETETVETESTETESNTESVSEEVQSFLDAWNNAANAERNVVLSTEDGSKLVLDLVDSEGTGDAIFKTKKAAEKVGETLDLTGIKEYAVSVEETNAQLVSTVADLAANSSATPVEEGAALSTGELDKFTVGETSLVIYDDLHIELVSGETVTSYVLAEADLETLNSVIVTLVEVLNGQPAECVLQSFVIE